MYSLGYLFQTSSFIIILFVRCTSTSTRIREYQRPTIVNALMPPASFSHFFYCTYMETWKRQSSARSVVPFSYSKVKSKKKYINSTCTCTVHRTVKIFIFSCGHQNPLYCTSISNCTRKYKYKYKQQKKYSRYLLQVLCTCTTAVYSKTSCTSTLLYSTSIQ